MDRHFLWWFRFRAGSLDHLRSTTQFGGPCGVSRQSFWVMFDDQVDYLYKHVNRTSKIGRLLLSK